MGMFEWKIKFYKSESKEKVNCVEAHPKLLSGRSGYKCGHLIAPSAHTHTHTCHL